MRILRLNKNSSGKIILTGMLIGFCLHPGCHPRPVLSIRLADQSLSPAPACVPASLGEWREKTPFEPAVIDRLKQDTQQAMQNKYLPRYNCRDCPVQMGSCQIRITLNLLPLSPSSSPNTQPCRMEITFDIIDPVEKSTTHSQSMARDCPDCSPHTLVQTGNTIIQQYLEKLYPEIKTVDCPLAVGQGKFDRQGRELVEKGDFQAALNAFRQAIDVNPASAPSLYNAGLLCEYLGDRHNAKLYYQRAWRVSPNPEYRYGLQRVMTR